MRCFVALISFVFNCFKLAPVTLGQVIKTSGRQRNRARNLLCYWCAIELRIPMADLSKRLDMTLAAVSYAVKRGEKIAKEAGCHLDN